MRTPLTSGHVQEAVVVGLALILASDVWGSQQEAPPERELADKILDATGVTGGLVVHLGCGSGKLTAALRADESFLVHGLDGDAKNVEKAREHLRSLGLYGTVSVDRLSGTRLPYVSNLVNLVVAEDVGRIGIDEVMRVLCPNGVAYVKQGGVWTKTVKPRSKEIDEWTHYLHDASGNAVSHDLVVGPPRHLQWVGSPRWSRHHDRMASMSALVTSGGRIFYIMDEGSRVSIELPSKWALIARDAFNGTILWKRSIPTWHPHLYPFKSGPAYLPRRLLAVGDTVYVTLGLDAPLSALDAATGETIRTYAGSLATEDVIFCDGVLFLVINETPPDWSRFRPLVNNAREERFRVEREWPWDENPRRLTAIEAETGRVEWEKEYPVVPLSLSADGRRVVFHDGEKIVCLDRRTGEETWSSKPVSTRPAIPTKFGPTLVVHGDVILFSGGDRRQAGLSAETGEILWTAEHPPSGDNSPEDLLVIGGLAWSGATAGVKHSGVFSGRDLHTGEVKKEFPPDVDTYWFHHRCHRAKATDKYLLTSRAGIEFIDFRAEHWEINHWVRGGCLYGIMPANGLIYAPPHDCACYPEAKLYGFNALAPADTSEGKGSPPASDENRLQPGPAYEQIINHQSSIIDPTAWPTYRHDPARSGSTRASVPANLKLAWQTELGGKLTSVVVGEGKLFVASVDTHTLYALDASSGETLWSYTTGGRVDSPPTIYQGRVLFGSADGWVYCLRASDGALVWRFRAAPEDRRLTSFEQVESVWPVHGSVLVEDGVLFCVAGRSMFLDGGLHLLRLDPKTGRRLSQTVLDDRDPETGDNLQVRIQVLNMPVGLPDVLSSDGRRVYMKSQEFDLQGVRHNLGPHSGEPAVQGSQQRGETAHLFAPMGFLDGSWFHRSYWVYGQSFAGGAAGYYQAGRFAPSGRILAVDESNVYGYGRLPQYLNWTTPLEYHLFATSKDIPDAAIPNGRGGGSQINIARSESLNPANKPLAVEAWVKAESRDGVILARGGPTQGYALLIRGGKPRFAVRADKKLSSVGANQNVLGKWVHLAGVLTAGKKLQIYVDGKLSASADAPGLITSDPILAMQIGADGAYAVGDYPSPFRLAGIIDEVKVFHGTVSAGEIEKHYQDAGRAEAAEASLVLCCSFDKGDATDESGNENHGTVAGAQPTEGKFGKAMKFTGTGASRAQSVVRHQWSKAVPLFVRAMVLADKTLFIAGPPDVVDEEEAFSAFPDAKILAKLAEQDAVLEGEKGASLWAVSAADGEKLAGYPLDSLPVWDGMAAAEGRLYLSTADGNVLCLAGR